MPIPAGSQVLEVQLWWSQDNQTLINQLHWYMPPLTIPETRAAAIIVADLAFFELSSSVPFLACFSAGITLERVSAQLVSPQRFAKGFSTNTVGVVGNRVGTSLQSSVQASTTTQADLAGPGTHGGNRWPGLVTDDVVGSMLKNAYKTDLAAMLPEVYGVPAYVPGTAKPCIYNRQLPDNSHEIVAFAVEPQARVLRRRVVGRGV